LEERADAGVAERVDRARGARSDGAERLGVERLTAERAGEIAAGVLGFALHRPPLFAELVEGGRDGLLLARRRVELLEERAQHEAAAPAAPSAEAEAAAVVVVPSIATLAAPPASPVPSAVPAAGEGRSVSVPPAPVAARAAQHLEQ